MDGDRQQQQQIKIGLTYKKMTLNFFFFFWAPMFGVKIRRKNILELDECMKKKINEE